MDDVEEQRCVICLEDIQEGDACGLLGGEGKAEKASCSHIFHRDCVVAWGKAAYSADKRPVSTSRSRRKPLPKCPTCRAEFGAFKLIKSGKQVQLATIMLDQFKNGGSLTNLEQGDSEEYDSERTTKRATA